jgi:thymidylate synthase (FAD)
MKVKLTLATPQIAISDNAKICYGTTGDKDITKSLVHGHGHLAALRFVYATVAIEGISVACQNQIVRSKHLDYMVQSKRYVNADKGGFEFIMPKGLHMAEQGKMRLAWDRALETYLSLLDEGIKKEDARAVLPVNTSTKMNVTGNLQGWWGFFKLRLNQHAQMEIRNVAEEIYNLLQQEYPLVFNEDVRKHLRNPTR